MSKTLEWAKDFKNKSKSEALTKPIMIKLWLMELADAIIADAEPTLSNPPRKERR